MSETPAVGSITVSHLSKSYRPPLEKSFPQLKLPNSPLFNPTQKTSAFQLGPVSFTIQPGEKIGLIGLNGSGKSTLLKILAGILAPDNPQQLSIVGRVIPLIELGAGFNPQLSGRENIFLSGAILGLTKAELGAQYQTIIDFAQLGELIDQPVHTYSSGQYLRLGFAIAIHCQPDILLLDEILAVGDLNFQQRCLQKLHALHQQGTTIIFVSHQIDLLRTFCDRTIYLEQGQIKSFGDSQSVCDQYLDDLGQSSAPDSSATGYQHRLFSPTQLSYLNQRYFLVDCWHHRVLHHSNLLDPISQWSTLTDDLAGPHSLASDGEILLVDDTGRHQLQVFDLHTFAHLKTISLPQGSLRPHCLRYHPSTQLFFCLCANSQNILAFHHLPGQSQLELVFNQPLPFLQNFYTRSFQIIGHQFYFVAGSDHFSAPDQPPAYQPQNAQIHRAQFNLAQQCLDYQESFPVPEFLANMNDLFFFQDHFYLSATPQAVIRCRSLSDLATGDYEDLTPRLNLAGTPYFFSFFQDRFFLPQINSHSQLTTFKVLSNQDIYSVKTLYNFGPPTSDSTARQKQFPL